MTKSGGKEMDGNSFILFEYMEELKIGQIFVDSSKKKFSFSTFFWQFNTNPQTTSSKKHITP